MASLISFYLLLSGYGLRSAGLPFSECLELLTLEELDLELLRGRSFSFLPLLLKKLNVLSMFRIVRYYYIVKIENYHNSCKRVILTPEKLAPYTWYYHSCSVRRRYCSLLTCNLVALNRRSYELTLRESTNSLKWQEPRQINTFSL